MRSGARSVCAATLACRQSRVASHAYETAIQCSKRDENPTVSGVLEWLGEWPWQVPFLVGVLDRVRAEFAAQAKRVSEWLGEDSAVGEWHAGGTNGWLLVERWARPWSFPSARAISGWRNFLAVSSVRKKSCNFQGEKSPAIFGQWVLHRNRDTLCFQKQRPGRVNWKQDLPHSPVLKSLRCVIIRQLNDRLAAASRRADPVLREGRPAREPQGDWEIKTGGWEIGRLPEITALPPRRRGCCEGNFIGIMKLIVSILVCGVVHNTCETFFWGNFVRHTLCKLSTPLLLSLVYSITERPFAERALPAVPYPKLLFCFDLSHSSSWLFSLRAGASRKHCHYHQRKRRGAALSHHYQLNLTRV